jgi:hypothetical protein
MPDRGLPLSRWGTWWNAILLLRPAFSRLRTFMWFVTAMPGLTVRVELLGVTSIVRALNLRPSLHTKLLDHFHSSGIERPCGRGPCWRWHQSSQTGQENAGRKLLHQQSESNTKPEYIKGHSVQADGLLVHAAKRSATSRAMRPRGSRKAGKNSSARGFDKCSAAEAQTRPAQKGRGGREGPSPARALS